ncbi:hypothetical protein BH09ACT12_BH09ACT12_03320 [soil metagenome]
MPPAHPPTGGRKRRRTGFIAGGALLGVGVLAAGAWAGYSLLLATGAQPAEALPDTTVGYVSVDLDPSGKQKLEALQTLRKFPGFTDNVDVAADDDLRLRLFEEIQGEGICPEVDFAEDVDPWLGDRFAVAAVDLGDADVEGTAGLGVTGVGVLQIDDAAAAEDGLAALNACGGEEESFGWSVAGDWAVVAETTEIAEEVTDAAADAPLSADEDFERWTGEAGDAGILTAYAAPEAGQLLADAAADFGAFGALGEFEAPDDATSDELAAMLDGFGGAALTIRFADGGLEIEAASGSSYVDGGAEVSDRGGDVVATLPDDTAVAFGVGLEEGWSDGVFETFSDNVEGFLGEDGLDSILSEAEAATGLDLPDDLETLLGDSTAIALSGSADLTAFEESEPPDDLPLGVKVEGDADEIAGIRDKILSAANDPSPDALLGYDTDGDYVAAGPSEEYRAALLEDGDLGDSDAYRDAVLNSDEAGAVLFVNFDAGDWLDSLTDLPPEIRENLAPLSALGLSGWSDDEVSHIALRISTD